MRISVFLPVIFLASVIVHGQDATQIYRNNVNSTVTIETEDALGSGFFVSDYIIATNYHVVENSSYAYCYTNNSLTKYKIEGYLAADKSADLILLKVSGLNRPSIKLAGSQVVPGQKVYALGSPKGLPATISDGIVSGLREFNGYKLIQMTAPISSGSSGGPVLDQNGDLVGISVSQLKEGQNLNFAIPKSTLQTLIKYKHDYPLSFSSLHSKKKGDTPGDIVNQITKNKVYAIGVQKKGTPGLTLDYVANFEDQSIFLFTYKHESKDMPFQTIWMDDYRLVDLETEEVYHASNTDLPRKESPRVIYNGTHSRFAVQFERLPSDLKRFSLLEGECTGGSFCFNNLNLDDYSEAEDFDPSIYLNNADEGTVSFYTTYPDGGELNVSIEDIEIGKIESYFSKGFTPECGQDGTLTIRLNAGKYKYSIRGKDRTYSWKGEFTISRNGCVKKGIVSR